MAHGGRIDSRLLHVQALYSQVKTGLAFVRSAEWLDHVDRGHALEFAQATHDATLRFVDRTALTPEEDRDLRARLARLQASIDALKKT